MGAKKGGILGGHPKIRFSSPKINFSPRTLNSRFREVYRLHPLNCALAQILRD